MVVSKRLYVAWGIGTIAATAALLGSGPQFGKQTLAPHELNTGGCSRSDFSGNTCSTEWQPKF
jgi:hypothetical protein